MPDVVVHGVTGCLADALDCETSAMGVVDLLEDDSLAALRGDSRCFGALDEAARSMRTNASVVEAARRRIRAARR